MSDDQNIVLYCCIRHNIITIVTKVWKYYQTIIIQVVTVHIFLQSLCFQVHLNSPTGSLIHPAGTNYVFYNSTTKEHSFKINVRKSILGLEKWNKLASCHWYIQLRVVKNSNTQMGKAKVVPILKHHAMKMYEGVEVQLQASLTSVTGG